MRGEYAWCDGSDAACVHGIPDFVSYSVEEFIEIPVGTPLALAEPVQDIKGGFHTLKGDKASPMVEDQERLGTIPTEPGRYAFQLHVGLEGGNGEHGSATFWFGVKVTDDALPAEPQSSEVLSVKCTEFGTSLAQGSVAAQHDGVHLEIDDLSAVAESLTIRWGENEQFQDSIGFGINDIIVSIPPGAASIACVPVGNEAPLTWVSFEVSDPDGRFQSDSLACESPIRHEATLNAG